MRHILGLSAYYHDAAAALLRDGEILAAAQEERFSRKKNDERFPMHAVEFCLRYSGLNPAQLDAVVFYDKPITKFARILETYLAVAPHAWKTFFQVLPSWLGEKLNLRKTIRDELPGLPEGCPILFTEHHQAHAASAFYPSPFAEAAILTVDGVGEWATTTLGEGRGHQVRILQEIRFPHSLGLLYSAFTAYCGFRINSGEYKLMGLAPYGEPRFVPAIREHLIDLKSDGSFWLNLEFFNFLRGFTMTNAKFHRLFGGPPRTPEAPVEPRHADVAASIQSVTEEVMVRLARQTRTITGHKHLCLAGGVALNCVANGRILRERLFERLWIQPAAGDAGGAVGAALAAWHDFRQREKENRRGRTSISAATDQAPPVEQAFQPAGSGDFPVAPSDCGREGPQNCGLESPQNPQTGKSALHVVGVRECLDQPTGADKMRGSLLGPEFSAEEIEAVLRSHRAVYERLPDETLLARTVQLLQQANVVGWVQGRMEFGPRALGNRSILGDPRSAQMQSVMNLKVKFRESFRPFAPAVRAERAGEYFELDTDSPYMLLVAPVKESLRRAPADCVAGLDRVKQVRSTIPAVTHVDHSARIQTVRREDNPRFYALLEKWEEATGCAVLVNTSFNVRGEPIVCTPDDAYRCFVNTAMDYLVIGDFVLERAAQPHQKIARTFEPVPD